MTQEVRPSQLTAFVPTFFSRPQQALDEALAQSHAAASRYQEWLQAVPEQVLHTPIAPGKWSPAEHADHIARMVRLFATLMDDCVQGRPMPEAELAYRWPDGRLLAPGPVAPAAGRSRDALRADLETGQRMLEDAARRAQDAGTLSVPCVPTGIFAPMTALEAVQAIIGHYPHHVPQPAARA